MLGIHHLFSADIRRYPWHPKAVYTPDTQALDPAPLSAYINYLDTHQIDRAILVHPEPYGDDHSLVTVFGQFSGRRCAQAVAAGG